MSLAAPLLTRLVRLTDQEPSDLYALVQTLPRRAIPLNMVWRAPR